MLITSYSWTDELEIQKKLSQEIRVNLNDVTISEALNTISKKAGVPFVLSAEAEWKLPQAGATRISVVLEGPLADSMTEMLNEFFMRYAVGDEQITIYPRPELKHLMGRPTAQQIKLLKKIYTAHLTFGGPVPSATFLGNWLSREATIAPVETYAFFDKFIAIIAKGISEGKQSSAVTLAQMLDEAGDTWYITPPVFADQMCEIRVSTLEEFNRAKYRQIVDISFEDQQAGKVIETLASWMGMDFYIDSSEPEWLEQEISINMQNIKLGQAFQNVLNSIGGSLEIRFDKNWMGVRGPKKDLRQRATPRRTKPKPASTGEKYVGKISVPMDDGKYYIEFMLREGDLTEELKKLRKEKINEILGVAEEQKPKPKPTEKK